MNIAKSKRLFKEIYRLVKSIKLKLLMVAIEYYKIIVQKELTIIITDVFLVIASVQVVLVLLIPIVSNVLIFNLNYKILLFAY
jgi:hypothetical protein